MDLGSGSTYSENMSAASGGPGGSQNQGPSGFGGGDSGGGNDVYSGYVAASQPRGGIQGIKNYFTGGGYDYGYQPTLGRTLGGIGSLILGSINPVLGGLNFLRKSIGPEFDRFRQAPTLDRYFRPEAYVDKPYVIGTNPMDYQRFNPSQFGQEYKYRDGIASLNIEPSMLVAELNPLEQRMYDTLKTGAELGFNTPEQNQKLQELEQKKNEQGYLGSSTFVV